MDQEIEILISLLSSFKNGEIVKKSEILPLNEKILHYYYECCKVFAMPSTGEGFGLVYLEAMQHGKPCVASAGGVASEIINDGETGMLVKPDDTLGLTQAIVKLLREETLRRMMGDAGRRRYLKYFTAEAFGQRVWTSILKSLDS